MERSLRRNIHSGAFSKVLTSINCNNVDKMTTNDNIIAVAMKLDL